MPLPPSHPFTKSVVFFRDRLVAFEVAARPALFTSCLRVKLTFLVAVGVLLPAACALDRLLVFEFLFDGWLSGVTVSAHELCASIATLVSL